MTWLYLLFFCSGLPALFYQLVWQRTLLTIYGITLDSVTIVVTAFMLGLGLGSLGGGWLSQRFSRHLLLLFSFIELAIGIFGYFSLDLFNWIGEKTIYVSKAAMLGITFSLVCLPTLLMGATLPLLVTHLVQQFKNVGKNVGILYFVNTLGSATACFLTALGLMYLLGLSGITHLAITFNILIGMLAFFLFLKQKTYCLTPQTSFSSSPISHEVMPFSPALILAALTGFITLSYEILWVRVYGFTSGGSATTFAWVLGFYLGGLACGALLSRDHCDHKTNNKQRLFLLFILLTVSSLLGFLFVPALGFLMKWYTSHIALILLGIITTLLGFTLPLILHSSVKPNASTGTRTSYIYFSNILGAASGSFITGFVLLDHYSLCKVSILLSLLGLALAIIILMTTSVSKKIKLLGITISIFTSFLIYFSAPTLFHHIYEKLYFKSLYTDKHKFQQIIENRTGVITVMEDGSIQGNGMYDGKFNTDLVNDKNLIIRAYLISAFVPRRENVLMIGLSSGSWAQVLANDPEVKNLTIIEINPGYLSIIPHHASVANLLKNSKVHIVIDDGRHWLRSHPQHRFDLIVMNTTWHWREHASNMLSTQFLSLARHSLTEKGVLFFNTTSSAQAYHTATITFPYALRIWNFIAVSDAPLSLDFDYWKKKLLNYKIDHRLVFDFTKPQHRQRFEEVMQIENRFIQKKYLTFAAIEPKQSLSPRVTQARIITDDNMGTEWLPSY